MRVASWLESFRFLFGARGGNQILYFLCLWVSFGFSLSCSEDRAFQRFSLEEASSPAQLPSHGDTNPHASRCLRLTTLRMGWAA